MTGNMTKAWATGALALSLALAAGTAQSAALSGVQGEVLVNQGSGFKPASGGRSLKTGDLVMAKPGGSAEIMYQNGCMIPVGPGAVVTVTAECPLVTGAIQTPGTLPGSSLAGAVGAGFSAALGLGVGVYSASQNQNNKPASP